MQKSLTRIGSLLTLTLAMSAPSLPARAAPMGYTDFASFEAALPGPGTILDFEAEVPGTPIPSGGSVEGVTFSYDFGGVQLTISDGFDTTSGTNFLGTDDGDVLLDLDPFELSFAPAKAIGMFFITADPLFDGDITLSAGGGAAVLATADLQETLPDGSDVYFLGVIDPASSFTQASVSTIGGGYFLYNVDDIWTAVPEPRSALLLLLGLVGLHLCGRRARRRGAVAVVALLCVCAASPEAARARPSLADLQTQLDDHEARIGTLEDAANGSGIDALEGTPCNVGTPLEGTLLLSIDGQTGAVSMHCDPTVRLFTLTVYGQAQTTYERVCRTYQCRPHDCNAHDCNPYSCDCGPFTCSTCYETCYDTCYDTCQDICVEPVPFSISSQPPGIYLSLGIPASFRNGVVTYRFQEGTEVTLESDGTVFSGGCTGTDVCVVTMDADKTVVGNH